MASSARSRSWPAIRRRLGLPVILVTSLALIVAMIGACGGSSGEPDTTAPTTTETTPAETTLAVATTDATTTSESPPIAATTSSTTTAAPQTTTTTVSPTTTTTTTTTVAPTTTTAPPTTTTTTTEAPTHPTLRRGDTGDAVARLQQLLTDQRYWLDGVDGIFGIRTEHAVVAFQKVAGLERNGVVDEDTWLAIEAGARPQPQSSSGRVLEVNLSKQVLLLVQDGSLLKVFDVSTGREGFRTPPGTHMIYDEVDGWHDSGWGSVWRPKYYYEPTALAFHGYKNVPPYPASHGCVRLINPAIDWLWDYGNVPVGTTVLIY